VKIPQISVKVRSKLDDKLNPFFFFPPFTEGEELLVFCRTLPMRVRPFLGYGLWHQVALSVFFFFSLSFLEGLVRLFDCFLSSIAPGAGDAIAGVFSVN